MTYYVAERVEGRRGVRIVSKPGADAVFALDRAKAGQLVVEHPMACLEPGDVTGGYGAVWEVKE